MRDQERSGSVTRDILLKIGQLGLIGMLVPQSSGTSGADFVSYVLPTEEIAGSDVRGHP